METYQTRSNFTLPLVALLMFVVGGFLALLGYSGFSGAQRYRSFVPVQAFVSRSNTYLSYSWNNGTGYYGHSRNSRWITDVTFQYQGPDHVARQQTAHLADSWLYPDWGNASTWDQGYWCNGKEFTMFVNPHDSNDWSLNQGPSREINAELASGCILALVGGLMFYPMLIRLFMSDGNCEYIPPDDPRALMRDTRLRL